MIIKGKMRYLGLEPKTSKKTGNSYLLVKMMEQSSVYEFYVPADKLKLVTDLGKLEQFAEVTVTMALQSFNNKPEVVLEGVN